MYLKIILVILLLHDVYSQGQSFLQGALNFNGITTSCDSNVDTTFLQNVYRTTLIPNPIVTMNFDQSTSNITINVTLKYIPHDSAWVVRFSAFSETNDDINLPGSCENRLYSTFSSLTFDQWWSHSGNALMSDSLNNVNNPIYYNNNNWILSALDCATIQYIGIFNVSSLGGCTTPQGDQELNVVFNSTTSVTTVSGNLVITMVIPIYNNYGSGGKYDYQTRSMFFPFQYSFDYSNVVTMINTNGGVYFSSIVTNVGIYTTTGNNLGKMYIQIQNTYISKGYGFINNARMNSTTGSIIILTSSDPNTIKISPSIQSFTFTSNSTSLVYDGLYVLSFDTYDCTPNNIRNNVFICVYGNTYNVNITILLKNIAVMNSLYSFGTVISLYEDNTFTIPKSSTFTDGNSMCFKNALNIGSNEQSNYIINILNVYICVPNVIGGNISYDGVKNFGCMNSSYNTLLNIKGQSTPNIIGNSVYKYYNPKVYNMIQTWNTGFCMNAMSRFMFQNGTLSNSNYKQYLQMDITINRLTSYGGIVITDKNVNEKNIILSHEIINGKTINRKQYNKNERYEMGDETNAMKDSTIHGMTSFMINEVYDSNTKNTIKETSETIDTNNHPQGDETIKSSNSKDYDNTYINSENDINSQTYHQTFTKSTDHVFIPTTTVSNDGGTEEPFLLEDLKIYIAIHCWTIIYISLAFLCGNVTYIYMNGHNPEDSNISKRSHTLKNT